MLPEKIQKFIVEKVLVALVLFYLFILGSEKEC
jgi:hypothetical protein